ncbi:MAG: hypothetical protein IKX43_03935 [Paludibacteraceae bacterium]|nr:hypothetical protein [Paludibacteraceae bacterium]
MVKIMRNSMLKSIYTILFALLFIQPAMSGSWLKNQSKSDVSFGEVCALVRRGDSGYCLVQKDGAIFLSTDGHSWVRSSKYTLGTLSCAHFYDESNGVAAGAKFLEYTTDGGVNWTKVDGVSLNVNAVCMVSEKEAVLACDGGNIGRYVFGKTLTSQKLNIKHNLYSVSFYDGTGYVCGKGGVILKWDGNQWNLLTKNGKSWTTQSINGSPTDLNEIRAIDARTVYACGKGGMLLKTMDGGETWTLCKKVAPEDFTSMTVKPDGTISLNAGLKQVTVNDQEGKYSVKTYYDQHGRVVASQNSKQRAMSPQRFSYMVYDALDRVVETGEMESNKEPTSLLIKGSLFSRFPNNMSGRRFQVVRTIYDKPIYNSPVNKIRKAFGGDQKHLRNRIATILYQKEYNSDPTQYDYATHYSYDIHGNVAVLVQDMPELESIGQRFKRINYEYGIVSGKVISMNYQPGQPDGYSLRYEYDDENRLTRVLASYYGNNTEREIARYEYYRHGPLARMVLGNTLQGVDYAYTLQGWTKGVNADAAGHDMGGDGKNNVKRDVYGYTLQYNENDYNPIGRDSSFYQSVSSGGLAGRDLYNGNIAKMSTYLTNLSSQTFGTQTRSFVYDELNRLKSSQVVGSADYKTSYDYDANGNITGLTRNGMNGQAIDNLTYHYALDKKGNILNNRLLHVNDSIRPVGNSSTSSDIKNQGDSYAQYDPTSHNYVYDKMGNLIKDKSEEIAKITWTATGKVSDVIRTNGSSKPDLHFDYDAMGQRIAKTVTNKNVTTGDLKVTTYYVRDPRGNVLAVYEKKEDAVGDGQFQLKERHLYGASRLGMVSQNVILTQFDKLTSNQTQNSTTPQLGNTHYELTNHLGNVMAVITDEATADSTPSIASLSDYYPFGMTEPGRNYSLPGDDYRFGYTGHEKENDMAEGVYTTEYRLLDTRLGRWMSVDPLFAKYPDMSSYVYCGGNPVSSVDPDGEDIYMLFYTSQNKRGDEMFKAAALTRKYNIEKSDSYNPEKDKVIVMAVQDLALIKESVDKITSTYSAKYGETAEFGIWSHAGLDGPTGTALTSSNSLDEKQMTLEGWSQIDFKWKNEGEGAKAGFYGCKTGVNPVKWQWTPLPHKKEETSFVTKISGLANFKNVSVWGQLSSAYPSEYTNYRQNTKEGENDKFILKEEKGVVTSFSHIYLVGRKGRFFNRKVALPMRVSKNNKEERESFQQGKTKND